MRASKPPASRRLGINLHVVLIRAANTSRARRQPVATAGAPVCRNALTASSCLRPTAFLDAIARASNPDTPMSGFPGSKREPCIVAMQS